VIRIVVGQRPSVSRQSAERAVDGEGDYDEAVSLSVVLTKIQGEAATLPSDG
jgi:hypothetical protein